MGLNALCSQFFSIQVINGAKGEEEDWPPQTRPQPME